MHRFYCPDANFAQQSITITDSNEIHHLRDVLRLASGDEIGIFNGHQEQAQVIIESLNDKQVIGKILSVRQAPPKTNKIILACAVPKKFKFEFIIEKCTELGVDEIIPLRTKRGEVVYSLDKRDSKQERFQKVALNAAKQCGRLTIPKIHPMTSFENAIKALDPRGLALIPSLNGSPRHMREILPNASHIAGAVTIFIGPEGDFTPQEVAMAIEAQCIAVSLGPTVLKVDTAAITTVALCAFFLYN